MSKSFNTNAFLISFLLLLICFVNYLSIGDNGIFKLLPIIILRLICRFRSKSISLKKLKAPMFASSNCNIFLMTRKSSSLFLLTSFSLKSNLLAIRRFMPAYFLGPFG